MRSLTHGSIDLKVQFMNHVPLNLMIDSTHFLSEHQLVKSQGMFFCFMAFWKKAS